MRASAGDYTAAHLALLARFDAERRAATTQSRMTRLERIGDAIEACLPLVALAVSALVLWGCM